MIYLYSISFHYIVSSRYYEVNEKNTTRRKKIRHTNTYKERETDRQTDRQTDSTRYKRLTGRKPDEYVDRQTGRQNERQPDRK